jgi:hypothetical protein
METKLRATIGSTCAAVSQSYKKIELISIQPFSWRDGGAYIIQDIRLLVLILVAEPKVAGADKHTAGDHQACCCGAQVPHNAETHRPSSK